MLHVRVDGSGPARAAAPAQLAEEGGSLRIHADTPVSASADGPFEPFAVAAIRSGALRDRLAAELRAPSLAAWRLVRPVVTIAAALPLLALLELDRELVFASAARPGRLFADLLLAAYVGFELTRRTPRLPGVAGAAMLAVALRWALFAARVCGKAHALVYAAAALAAAAGAAILTRAPSRERVALELGAKLGIARADMIAVRRPAPVSTPLLVGSVVAALGLPALLHVAREAGAGIETQGAAFVAYALVVPELVKRALGQVDPTPAVDRVRGRELALAVGAGLALTFALAHGADSFFDTGSELARCVGRLDAESRRLLEQKGAELTRALAAARASTPLVVMAAAVVPFAEERVYRGLLLPVLSRRYGATYGLFASSVVFGLAHFGVYQLALYQTVLLGLAFGVAYAEGGLLAAFVVHGVWNLVQLA